MTIDFSEEIAAIAEIQNSNLPAAKKSSDIAHVIQRAVAQKLGLPKNSTVAEVKRALGLPNERGKIEVVIAALKKYGAAPDENPAEKSLVERISILEEQNKNLAERLARLERIVTENKNLEERFKNFKDRVGI